MLIGYWHQGNEDKYQEQKNGIQNRSDRYFIDIKDALMQIHKPVYIVEHNGKIAGACEGIASIGDINQDSTIHAEPAECTEIQTRNICVEGKVKKNDNADLVRIRAYLPPLPLDNLGDPGFKARHNLKYPYIAGAMANGITSVEMVESMARNGMMAFFGSGGLSLLEVESAIVRLKKNLFCLKHNADHTCASPSPITPSGSVDCDVSVSENAFSAPLLSDSYTWGFNFIHSHGDPELEMALARLYIKHEVRRISAAAFMRITIALVYYRLKGIYRNMEGNIITPNQIIAKVSRIEVARQFFSPPPPKLVAELLNKGLISSDEADLAQYIPMAQDLTAEADSGGHTDNRPAISLWPTMIALKNEFNEKFNYFEPLCVGFAGGISTPESAAAAFQMGAAYVLTGSINQSCIEAATSNSVKALLAQAEQADVAMAPAADMFEIGARVQVLKRGTMFSVRAEKLYQVYKTYERFEDVPEKLQKEIEDKFLHANFYQKWEETKEFFKTRNIRELERAEADPRHKMALVFRSYLGLSSRWSISGDPQRVMDYQIWCGPAIGAFNQWAKGTFLEKSENRKVSDIAFNLLFGASVCMRAAWLKNQGINIPGYAGSCKPVERSELMKNISLKA